MDKPVQSSGTRLTLAFSESKASGDGVGKMPYWKNRTIWSWALYDFANSAFATTILSVIFNVYFATRVVPPEGAILWGARIPGTALWAYTVSFSMLLTFLMMPVLGAWADWAGNKRSLLTFFWLMGCFATVGLSRVGPGDVGKGILFFVIGNMGFAGGNVFYNAFLPELVSEKELGRVSGFGWAVGYVGGGLCLFTNLMMLNFPGAFGLAGEEEAVRFCFLVVAVWWFLFGLPQRLFVKERAVSRAGGPGRSSAEAPRAGLGTAWRVGSKRVWHTLCHLREHGNLVKFLAAYLVYNDGIETIILMASLFGAQVLGMTLSELTLCFLMIQGVASLGAWVFGWMADRFKHKPIILITHSVSHPSPINTKFFVQLLRQKTRASRVIHES